MTYQFEYKKIKSCGGCPFVYMEQSEYYCNLTQDVVTEQFELEVGLPNSCELECVKRING